MPSRSKKTAPPRASTTQPSRFRRGVDLLNSRKYARARRELEKVVREGGPDRPWAVQEFLQTFLRRGKAEEAEEAFRKLLPEDSALFQHGLAYLYRLTGRVPQAIELLEAAYRRRPKLWAVNNELGWLRCATGRFVEGLRLLRSATKRFEANQDSWGLATAMTHRGAVALMRWRVNEAVEVFERALQLKAECGDRLGHATCLYHLGGVKLQCHDLGVARELLERALEEQRDIGFPRGAAFSLNLLGSCFVFLGDGRRARAAFKAALQAQRRAGVTASSANESATKVNLSHAALIEGRARSALEQALSALALADREAESETVWHAICRLAEYHVSMGQPRKALGVLRLADDREIASPQATLMLWCERARAKLALGDAQGAEEAAVAAVAAGESASAPRRAFFWRLMRAKALLGRAMAANGRVREARRLLERAARHVERVRIGQGSQAARNATLQLHRDVVDARIVTEMADDEASSAWGLARDTKALELRASLNQRHPSGRYDSDARVGLLLDRPHLTPAELRQLNRLLEPRDGDPAREPAGRGDLDVSTFVERLPEDAALIEYHVTVDALLAFVVHDRGVRTFTMRVPERGLARLVETLLGPLQRAAAGNDTLRHLQSWDVELAFRLHGLILAPILATLPERARRLVVVPDGPLHLLPFECLVQRLPTSSSSFERHFGSCAYVSDDFVVNYLPSARLIRSRRAPSRSRRSLLVVHSPQRTSTIQVAEQSMELRPLPGARAEVEAVRKSLRTAKVLGSNSATPQQFLKQAREADLIHVAAHGISDARASGMSGLVLADEHSESEFLRSEVIAATPLRAELVTLSACSTAFGRLQRHEGTLGLSRAFLLAGACSVVASCWAVEDESSKLLMVKFYEELRSGAERSASLARARRYLRAAGSKRVHPFFWCSHVLFDREPFVLARQGNRPPASMPAASAR